MKRPLRRILAAFAFVFSLSASMQASSFLSLTNGAVTLSCDNSQAFTATNCGAGFITSANSNTISFSGQVGGYSVASLSYTGNAPGLATLGTTNDAKTTIQNISGTGASASLIIRSAQNNFSLPAGSPLTLAASQSGTFAVATAGDKQVFTAFGNAANTLTIVGVPEATPDCVTLAAAPPTQSCNTDGTPTTFARSGNFALAGSEVITLGLGHLGNFTSTINVTPPPCPPTGCPFADGRMTGGGSIFTIAGNVTGGGIRVTHGFEIHCDPNNTPNRLEVNFPDANNFHMLVLTNATCTFDPAVGPPNQPAADFNTFDGVGIGKFNNVPDYKIVFKFTDAGEPGRDDIAVYKIFDPNGNLVFQSGGNTDQPIKLTFGNHQAHKAQSNVVNVLGIWATYSDARSYPDYWPPTGYTANTSVKSTFTRVANNPYKSLGTSSLLNALSFSDGSDLTGAAQTLLRVATQALLDASHPSVVYRLSATEVIAKVNAALDSQDRGIILQLASDLASYDALKNFQIPVVTPPKRKGN